MAEEYVTENENGESFVNIWLILKRYALFIIITAFVFCCAGFAYSRLRTPTYTASETLSYTVSDNDGIYLPQKEQGKQRRNRSPPFDL